MKRSVCVAGGGASGMMAAIAAARAGAEVTLFEKNDRVGKKLLMTGNGRCNLTNLYMGAFNYDTESGSGLVESVLQKFCAQDLIRLFEELGMDIMVDRTHYVYPKTQAAATVLNVLRRSLKEYGVICETGVKIKHIKKENETFKIETGRGDILTERIILSCGGKSFPKTGSDGTGFLLAKNMGLSLIPDYPSLTALVCHIEGQKILSGLRSMGEVTLFIDHTEVSKDQGQIQFTDYGLSGIPVFQISGAASRALRDAKMNQRAVPDIKVRLNLFPEMPQEVLLKKIERQLSEFSHLSFEEAMAGMLHKKWIDFLDKRLKASFYFPTKKIPKELIKRLTCELTELVFPVKEVKGYDFCQVTGGGVKMSQVDEHLQVKAHPGLYVTGEMLDVTGKCGGYNLQWAFSTGYIAGSHAAEQEAL